MNSAIRLVTASIRCGLDAYVGREMKIMEYEPRNPTAGTGYLGFLMTIIGVIVGGYALSDHAWARLWIAIPLALVGVAVLIKGNKEYDPGEDRW